MPGGGRRQRHLGAADGGRGCEGPVEVEAAVLAVGGRQRSSRQRHPLHAVGTDFEGGAGREGSRPDHERAVDQGAVARTEVLDGGRGVQGHRECRVPAGNLVAPEHDTLLRIPPHHVVARSEPHDQAGVVAVQHPEGAGDTGLDGARLRTRSSDTDRHAVYQRAFGDGLGSVEWLVADEAAATADRQRQRVEHGADPGLGIGRHLDVVPGIRAGVVHAQSEDHPLLRSRRSTRGLSR